MGSVVGKLRGVTASSGLSHRVTAIFLSAQIWFRPVAPARRTGALVIVTGNVRPIDTITATANTRGTEMVHIHRSMCGLTTHRATIMP